ncbi:MAG: lptD [Deltaproteobacteria bacterium]|nr:lptD [Deltaproteobacteria bacterium]
MRSFKIFAFIAIFAIVCPLIVYGQGIGLGKDEITGPVEITADEVQHDRAANTYTARGKAHVKEATRTVDADYIFLDDNTKDVTAEGNVVYEDMGDRIEAERMQINLETKKGNLEKARVFIKTGNVYINGNEIEKTGESQYKIKKGKFTTCGWDKAEWTFTSDEVDITVQGYATTKSTTFNILGVPVFYVPWGIFPVKTARASGFLMPEMGTSSSDGAKFKLSYFWAISKDTDATLSAEYMSKRGVMAGAQYRYFIREDFKGELEGNIIDDNDYGHTRYQLKAKHEQVFFKDLKLKANIWHVSDDDYLEDFGKTSTERSESQLKSTVYLEKPLHKSLLTGGATKFRNLLMQDDSTIFQYYPEITYFTEYIPIAHTNMYLDLNSSLTNFYRDKGDTFTRITIDPSLRLPLPYKGLNTLVSGTLYESGYLVNRGDTYDGSTKNRQTFRLDADTNMQFLRTYFTGWSSLQSMQSVIKPAVRYTFIPPTGYRNVPQIDAYDRMDQTNILTYSLNHYLYEADENGGKREMSLLEVSQTYGLSGNLGPSDLYKGSGSRFSDIDARFTFSPINNLSFTHESLWNVNGEGAKILRHGFTYNIPKIYMLTMTHSYSNGYGVNPFTGETVDQYTDPATGVVTQFGTSNQIFLSTAGTYSVFQGGYEIRYEFTTNEWIDTAYWIRYKPGCWSTTLSLSQTKRPNDTSFKISFDLTGITSQ